MWQRRHDLRCAGRCHAPYVPPTEGRIFVDLSTGFVWTSHRSEACRLGQAPGFSRGVHDNRDQNAAINILRKAKEILTTA